MTGDGAAALLAAGPEGPALRGTTCGRCALVAFPAEPYGCERCGAPPAALAPTALAPTGTVRSRAVVHRHHRPEPATPFVVVEVALDAGPAVTAVLAADPAADPGAGPGGGLGAGARVRAVDDGGRFRFTADGAP